MRFGSRSNANPMKIAPFPASREAAIRGLAGRTRICLIEIPALAMLGRETGGAKLDRTTADQVRDDVEERPNWLEGGSVPRHLGTENYVNLHRVKAFRRLHIELTDIDFTFLSHWPAKRWRGQVRAVLAHGQNAQGLER